MVLITIEIAANKRGVFANIRRDSGVQCNNIMPNRKKH